MFVINIFRRDRSKCDHLLVWEVLHNCFVRDTIHVHSRNVSDRDSTFVIRHMFYVRQNRINGGTSNALISKYMPKCSHKFIDYIGLQLTCKNV